MEKEKKIKTWHIVLLVLIGLTFVFLKLWQMRWPDTYVELKDQKLHVLVADNTYRLYRGLGKRESLGEYNGMLFLFGDSDRHGIVMREMHFPIDIVWLEKGEVIDIAPNIPTEEGVQESELKVFYPRKNANIVLELPAGWVVEHGLKIGDKMSVVEDE